GLTALRVDDPRLAEVGQDRLEEVVRDVLEPTELLRAHRASPGVTVRARRHLDQGAQRVVGLGRDSHGGSLPEPPADPGSRAWSRSHPGRPGGPSYDVSRGCLLPPT